MKKKALVSKRRKGSHRFGGGCGKSFTSGWHDKLKEDQQLVFQLESEVAPVASKCNSDTKDGGFN